MNEKVTLYHGSYCAVEHPDLAFCSNAKDFGRGFYLTTNEIQARNFVKTSIKKAASRGVYFSDHGRGFVNVYECVLDNSLQTFTFENADLSWLHCVAAHRSEGVFPGEVEKWRSYDLICGKIANDKTNTVISAYIDGLYGPVESDRAGEIAIGFLEPENLVDQWCFRSVKALGCLKFVKAVRL
ncbi:MULTISPECIES: DUF3990 domain-containing protein [unclassified Fibrobacter]|uniref:DUF3990 domain-containing protein n=1 Tax=unclassified Fibrobacter TaxID=2634177 RepID=UPI000D6B0530|nr:MULTISPECIES: DUF3990 domain-containing protein [unclassified Fibrobacter]PWJ68341.1 uncharacterized protein DUF3990 [Fibrobacter sp. UWR4]PZW68125.1 uncharacterized protein DUF3990 [Fibrobacter sp. UWR1]